MNKAAIYGCGVLIIVGLCPISSFLNYLDSQSPAGIARRTVKVQTETAKSMNTVLSSHKTETRLANLLTSIIISTSTIKLTKIMDTLTSIIITTQFPTATETSKIVLVATTATRGNHICNCKVDYNCSDFIFRSKAQACFNSCVGKAVMTRLV